MAALRELAGGRADLLAEVAGIFEGTGEGELDEPLTRQAAALCRKAGADPEAIPEWIEEGRRRRIAVKSAAAFGRCASRVSAAALRPPWTRAGHEAASGSHLACTSPLLPASHDRERAATRACARGRTP